MPPCATPECDELHMRKLGHRCRPGCDELLVEEAIPGCNPAYEEARS